MSLLHGTGYLAHPDKRDKEILAFAKSMSGESGGVRMYVSELGFYSHCANEYQVLLVGADRDLVRRIRKLLRERAQ